MTQHSHVPKFGNWENDNVPYTAYFENARKERGGVMINPNDPMEKEGSLEKRRHQHVHHKSAGSFSSSSHHRHTSGSHSFSDSHMNHHQGTTIPKFGTWDVSDPKSGEGYTAIFSKIKEEKQIASGHSPTMTTPPLNNCSNIKNQYEGNCFSLSKYCCCLFSSQSK